MQLLQPEMLGMLLSNVNQEGILVEPASANDVSFTEMFLSNSGFTLPVPVNCRICTKMVRFFFFELLLEGGRSWQGRELRRDTQPAFGSLPRGQGENGMGAGLWETQAWGDVLWDSFKVILTWGSDARPCSCGWVGVSFWGAGWESTLSIILG